MAPPATKRRKLKHEGKDRSNEERFPGDASNEVQDDIDENESDENDSDEKIHDDSGSLEEGSDDGHDLMRSSSSKSNQRNKQRGAAAQARAAVKSHMRQDATVQDGVYTAEVYKSNIFKLQVDELLKQVRPRYGEKMAPAEHAMRTLKSIIEQLPSREPLSVPEAERLLHNEGVVIPFPAPQPPKDAKYKFYYDRPANINATGSYPLKIATRTDSGLEIDLVVTMPKSVFQDKDYLNYRYFYKRAYYLACLAAGIKNSKEHDFDVSFACLNGNPLQPIIVIRPTKTGGFDDFSSSKCVIHILVASPEHTFAENKLHPKSNSIRPKGPVEDNEGQSLKPTPFYNSTVQSDMSVTAYLKFLHAASNKCEDYKNACLLGRVWLQQRGLGSDLRRGGFGNFEWAATMAILLQTNPGSGNPPLLPCYSSYQLFKATLQFLSNNDLYSSPYKFLAGDITLSKADIAPTLFDGPRNLNLLFKMTPWSYAKLKSEAKSTMDMLGDSLFDQFEPTFILRTDMLRYHYDATLEIPLSSFDLEPTDDHYDQLLFEKCHKTYTTLIRALTDRTTGVFLTLPGTNPWPIFSSKPHENPQRKLLVSFELDAATSSRTVDHGPAAEEKKEAALFRQFWGEKAELRRFKDGSILESVVWSLKYNPNPVVEQIVHYALKKHLGLSVAEHAMLSLDSFLSLINPGRHAGQPGISAFSGRMNALSALEKDVRSLEGLPLQIRQIQAADPQLRFSAIEADSMRMPASLVVQFEGSARWPDDLCAIQRTKIAFLLKLSEQLSTEKAYYFTRVGLENPSQPSQNQAYLDITVPHGFSFRLRIHHDREATLLNRQLNDKTLDGPSRETAASALATYKRDYLHSPSHTQAMQTLCTRFAALSPSIRLTKRWFAAHLLLPHFPEELIELSVVRTFLQPHPWTTPSCATTGFLRTLMWISRWDWRHTPLVVDFSSASPSINAPDLEGIVPQGLKSKDIDIIQTRLEAWRRIDPAMNRVVLFAATNLDKDGTTWTDKGRPEKVVAARMTSLAKAATSAIRIHEERLISAASGNEVAVEEFTPSRLFIPSIHDYDIVLHISAKHSKPGRKKVNSKFKNVEVQQGALGPGEQEKIGYSPVKGFVNDLLEVYGDAVLWFWDSDKMDVIAGLWNPGVTQQRTWKVKPSWNSIPVKGDPASREEKRNSDAVDIQANKNAICNEVGRLGGELLAKIEVFR